jgi:hypothetical protein
VYVRHVVRHLDQTRLYYHLLLFQLAQLLKRPGGDREMVEILALVLQHDEEAVLCAVELALEAGVATKTHVINVLHRLTDGKAPPAASIDAPQALRLTRGAGCQCAAL